ncbi:hypothetical protein KUTeg_021855 [Tegillarca granosa]|uniref:Uncharacterized protein n=1 Tax=Tegillarca granosa TaxID=220873 RepID=A0ABQ9E4J3_TEGGR|nr:hypothetical protein KUTeg_021855 [Tegillarca granosa]
MDLTAFFLKDSIRLLKQLADNYGIRQESSERLPGMIVPEGIDLNDYESLWNLAEQLGEVRNPGASNQEIGQLPVHQYNKTSQRSLESGECHRIIIFTTTILSSGCGASIPNTSLN